MIGVKQKKTKKTTGNVPDFDLQEGQGAIYGFVTQFNPLTNQTSPVANVQVSILEDNQLVGFSITFEDGYYQIDAVDAPKDYRGEFVKDGIGKSVLFSLASKQIKQVNVELE